MVAWTSNHDYTNDNNQNNNPPVIIEILHPPGKENRVKAMLFYIAISSCKNYKFKCKEPETLPNCVHEDANIRDFVVKIRYGCKTAVITGSDISPWIDIFNCLKTTYNINYYFEDMCEGESKD